MQFLANMSCKIAQPRGNKTLPVCIICIGKLAKRIQSFVDTKAYILVKWWFDRLGAKEIICAKLENSSINRVGGF